MAVSRPSPARRARRGAAETRAAILRAAQAHFAREGYEHAGVRQIAADAGVTAALVNRYFGGKEKLFAEAIGGSFQLGSFLPDDPARIAEVVASYIASKHPERLRTDYDPLLLILRSATSPAAAALLTERMDARTIRPLAEKLGGPHAEVRAGLVAALITGVGVVRRLLRSEAFRDVDADTLARLLTPVIQACIAPALASAAGDSGDAPPSTDPAEDAAGSSSGD